MAGTPARPPEGAAGTPATYDPQAVEAKWQARWAEQGTYQVDNDDPRPPFYVLCMYPYPSGPAHQGHVRNYTFGDLLVRNRTMHGYGVLSPFGFDSFGLPAENAAIRTGTHPRIFSDARIEELKTSIRGMGAVYDWRREVRSHDPEYMKWNQVIFQRFLENGLAYRKKAPVNWCPGCQTVLANEQVLSDGTCERSGDLVVKRDLEQWFFKITEYADELLEALDDLDWPDRVKTMQRNWIGRSEGAEFEMVVAGREEDPNAKIRVFTTRPDTSFGMTFVVLAPEHPLVPEITTADHKGEVEAFIERVFRETRYGGNAVTVTPLPDSHGDMQVRRGSRARDLHSHSRGCGRSARLRDRLRPGASSLVPAKSRTAPPLMEQSVRAAVAPRPESLSSPSTKMPR